MDPPTSSPSGGAVLLAHGAGGHKDHAHILDLSALLRSLGLAVIRFNFPYRDRGKGPPDPMPVLMETVSAVAAAARKTLSPGTLILAGHSLGGRAASMAVAEGLECDGLLLSSYPWHPPGKADRLRVSHLPGIRVPVLCFTGTRDAFCDREKTKRVFDTLPRRWTQAWVEAADHGLEALKKSGRSREDVLEEVREATRRWLQVTGLTSSPAGTQSDGRSR